jgi:hypothetical protein
MPVSEEKTRKGNGVIHSEARELISKVIQSCEEEARKKRTGISSKSGNQKGSCSMTLTGSALIQLYSRLVILDKFKELNM